jgi:hypothetical protein
METFDAVSLYLLIKSVSIGAGIGAAGSALLYRSRLTPGAWLKSIALGVLGYQVGFYLAFWGESHSYIVNGIPMERSESGENLWLRNRLAAHEVLLPIMVAITAILVGYILRRRHSPHASPMTVGK